MKRCCLAVRWLRRQSGVRTGCGQGRPGSPQGRDGERVRPGPQDHHRSRGEDARSPASGRRRCLSDGCADARHAAAAGTAGAIRPEGEGGHAARTDHSHGPGGATALAPTGMATSLLHRLLAPRRGAPARLVIRERPDLTAWLTRRGVVHVTDALLLERLLRPTVRVAPKRLDEYVGRYETDGMEPITIERFGDSLVSKARDTSSSRRRRDETNPGPTRSAPIGTSS
jgi:hypothetical protein